MGMGKSELIVRIIDDYLSSRPNLEVESDAICLFFLACSGSGKSTIRKNIVSKLRYTYVCNDEVRTLLKRYPDAAKKISNCMKL